MKEAERKRKEGKNIVEGREGERIKNKAVGKEGRKI